MTQSEWAHVALNDGMDPREASRAAESLSSCEAIDPDLGEDLFWSEFMYNRPGPRHYGRPVWKWRTRFR